MVGVDLSPKMLAQAQKKLVYDELYDRDLREWVKEEATKRYLRLALLPSLPRLWCWFVLWLYRSDRAVGLVPGHQVEEPRNTLHSHTHKYTNALVIYKYVYVSQKHQYVYHILKNVYTSTHTFKYTYTHIYTYIYIYIHIYIYVCMLTYKHMHTLL